LAPRKRAGEKGKSPRASIRYNAKRKGVTILGTRGTTLKTSSLKHAELFGKWKNPIGKKEKNWPVQMRGAVGANRMIRKKCGQTAPSVGFDKATMTLLAGETCKVPEERRQSLKTVRRGRGGDQETRHLVCGGDEEQVQAESKHKLGRREEGNLWKSNVAEGLGLHDTITLKKQRGVNK